MIIYTDHPDFAEKFYAECRWQEFGLADISPDIASFAEKILPSQSFFQAEAENESFGNYFFLIKHSHRSHYDIITELIQKNTPLPDGLFCLADSGDKFHGLRGRDWSACPGNIHLVAYLTPNQPVDNYGLGFTILSTVSVVQAVDELPDIEKPAMTKWVNDVVIDGAKVCGVLTHTQAEGKKITGAVLGIGLNVETTPEVTPSRFVPRVASLREFATETANITQAGVLKILLKKLQKNYSLFLGGGYPELIDLYRNRSAIIGEVVEIHPDSPYDRDREVITGRVTAIGDNLELTLEGHKTPILKGRLALKN